MSGLINILKRIANALGVGEQNVTPRYRSYPMPNGAGVAGNNITLTANAAANTWALAQQVQVVLIANQVQPFLITDIIVGNPSANAQYTIGIMTGVAGAGVAIDAGCLVSFTQVAGVPQPFLHKHLSKPIAIRAGSGIVARMQSTVGLSTIDIKIEGIEGVAGNFGLGF